MGDQDGPAVLLVGGDDALLDEMRDVLSDGGFSVSCNVRSTASALDLARRQRPRLVLMDVTVPGDVTGAVRALHRERIAQSVMIMPRVDAHLLADLMLAGAAGAVTREELPILPVSLHAVLGGEPALSRRLVARLLVEYRIRDEHLNGRGLTASLSPREREVIELLRRGHSTHEVARELFLQPVTIRSHVASAVRKLHLRTRAEVLGALDAADRTHQDDAGRA